MSTFKALAMASLLVCSGCASDNNVCSAPKWPFYIKYPIKNRDFYAVIFPDGRTLLKPNGCDRYFPVRFSSETPKIIGDVQRIGKVRGFYGHFDGEITYLDKADMAIIDVTSVRSLRERHADEGVIIEELR